MRELTGRPTLYISHMKMWTILLTIFSWSNVEGNNIDPTIDIIATQGCSIPGYPILTESIRIYSEPPAEIKPNCSEFVPLVKSNDTHIWVQENAFYLFEVWDPANFYCCYKNFSAEKQVETVSYGECTQFISVIEAQHKYVRVECYYMDNKIYDDFFLFNINLAGPNFSRYKGSQNMPKYLKASGEHAPHILMLGFESMSRMNFIRSMPKTAKYLEKKGSIQLFGYNKLGDNSYPNLFPLLTGRSFEDVKSTCKQTGVFDTRKCPFIWDRFKNEGYSTALAADSGAGLLGIYEYVLPEVPTDFYLQPFMYETRFLFKDRTYDYHLCLRNRYYYKVLLGYVRSVTSDAKRGKFFGIFWEESVSHAHFNYNHIMDQEYVNLLMDLENNDFLDNAILVLFSDHGTRLGKVVETEQGRQESRLPLFEILLPPKFKRSHRLAYEILKNNSRRLTTPYDVHQTLLDIVNLSSLSDHRIKQRTHYLNENSNHISLFLPIPENRTCRSIGISDHWCTCRRGDRAPVGVKEKLYVAHYLINYINKMMRMVPKCYRLELDKIIDVSMMKDNNSSMYSVVVQVSPGPATFEGTLVSEAGQWAVSGDISRLNLYREQSHCIEDILLKPYCVCKQRRL